ncbi:hypothetical protein BSR29_03595 [Boudabousia liubingyangii]|uniref:Carbohydrate kinase PfkB domain-containing protein n=1 Tax=Boudabousia liubingyangii TaxID=1921764 RepID=A0A1Q5PN30_9ACTO|nr:PfkB family carbohydrate kinase [Boudabousia liubingyangii]OKL47513.1 hypothetical protein BSR28_03165 [Boudabousia liubingyangii]OKL48936.1 hypothetical protein BSR29_03595 [Boudabousia liubingyangii]
MQELSDQKSLEHPRLISTAAVSLTLPMQVPHLPAEGTSVTASSSFALVGDGFVVASAAARQGVPVSLASPLGTGTNSHAVRAALMEEGIELAVEDMVGDTGMSISLIQSDGLMTTVRSPGVEYDPQLSDLRRVDVHPEDWVYVAGQDLAGGPAGEVLSTWATELPEETKFVASLGGAIQDIPMPILEKILPRCDVLTMNLRQATVLARRLNLGDPLEAARSLVPESAILVWRRGRRGSVVQQDAHSQPIAVRSFERPRVDTTGVGDTHTGVLIASLLQGRDLLEAVLRANIASSFAVSKFGTALCPRALELDEFMAQEGVHVSDHIETYEG